MASSSRLSATSCRSVRHHRSHARTARSRHGGGSGGAVARSCARSGIWPPICHGLWNDVGFGSRVSDLLSYVNNPPHDPLKQSSPCIARRWKPSSRSRTVTPSGSTVPRRGPGWSASIRPKASSQGARLRPSWDVERRRASRCGAGTEDGCLCLPAKNRRHRQMQLRPQLRLSACHSQGSEEETATAVNAKAAPASKKITRTCAKLLGWSARLPCRALIWASQDGSQKRPCLLLLLSIPLDSSQPLEPSLTPRV